MSEILDERKMKKLTSKAHDIKREHSVSDDEDAAWGAIDSSNVGSVLVNDNAKYLTEELDEDEMVDASNFEYTEEWHRANAKIELAKRVAERM